MKINRFWRLTAVVGLVVILAGGAAALRIWDTSGRTRITAYFANSTGIFPGDDVRILGVRVGEIATIEGQPTQVKITMWVDDSYRVPVDAKAVILSPSLISARAVQLVPAYTGGPVMADHAVIPIERTAVPVEWDDLRDQLAKLADALQPTQPGGVSTLGAYVNTAADNLRGQGTDIHRAIKNLATTMSALGDHSDDIFGTVENLALVVSALQDSRDVMRELNRNLASTTQLLDNQPQEIGAALDELNAVLGEVASFTADNRETIGVTADKLASISGALHESRADLEQTLHVAPTELANFVNIYPPAIGGFAGAFSLNNFSNPIQFLCGAIQAASRLNAEQSAKLCVQYLAPIVKNRQINFPPLGVNPVVGAYARPNEITYSEDWMRPDYVPPPGTPAGPGAAPLPAEQPQPPSGPPVEHGPQNLHDMLIPAGAGS
ncbi:virulence factor Mce family protein [Mycolicibacterium sp. 624]|uniref:virulence factor Mce family protein n=1 Tax=Mycolicibacterium sp. 624 TaxID=3156314 RepID=UPI003396025B